MIITIKKYTLIQLVSNFFIVSIVSEQDLKLLSWYSVGCWNWISSESH